MTSRNRRPASLIAAATFTLCAGQASAQTTTLGVVAATVASAPSCLSYQVKGVCFFLRCGLTGCSIRTTIRVSHYMPDVVISTYNDQYLHPWADVGTVVSGVGSTVGAALLATPLDSSANTDHSTLADGQSAASKGADAIGNPLVVVNNVSSALVTPGVAELMRFPSTVPSIGSEWAAAPAALLASVPSSVLSLINNPSSILQSVSDAATVIDKVTSIKDMASSATKAVGDATAVLEKIKDFKSILDLATTASGGTLDLLCPSSASPLGVYFQSDADALFWRGILPLELLYVGSWMPGYKEVSRSPLANTWGSIYPRQGQLVQDHPVKASAVFAQRVTSIITQRSQPHVYAPLNAGSGGYRWFARLANPKYSMVYPIPSGCMTFGENDSVSLTSFGDFKTTSSHGYIWNLWNRYDCCRSAGRFLFTVP
jgi:integrating conjugative element protein (TIGR03756 family)